MSIVALTNQTPERGIFVGNHLYQLFNDGSEASLTYAGVVR